MKPKRIACPVHGGRDPNCAVWRDDRGKLRAKCWSRGCGEHDILTALGEPYIRAAEIPCRRDEAERAALALKLWRASRMGTCTLVERYLRERGLRVLCPPTLRFHPSLRHPSGVYAPAMIAAVERVSSGTAVIAVHRTFLRADGTDKANLDPQKAALGPIAGGAVRLAPPGETLALAEGIETALSVQQATGLSAWAALGTANLSRVELPYYVRDVDICADADGPGEKAALAAAAKLMREGRKVRIARPLSAGTDFNDLLRS
jgi:phage/plasmid primase-like uncharacterized protein